MQAKILLVRRLLPILCAAIGLFCNGPTSPRPGAPSTRCGTLGESQCILAAQCTLVLVGETPSSYVCRSAQNPCEAGFIQRTGTEESCEEKEGCLFEPGMCYCPPDLVCVCGGGPPPQCRPAAG
jgi:hypothetical protein